MFLQASCLLNSSTSSWDHGDKRPVLEDCRVARGTACSSRNRSGPVSGGIWRVPAAGTPHRGRERADISFRSSRARSTDPLHSPASAHKGTSPVLFYFPGHPAESLSSSNYEVSWSLCIRLLVQWCSLAQEAKLL